MTSKSTKKRRYLDDTNVIHIVNQPAQYDGGEIKQGENKNIIANAINQYVREAKHTVINKKIPKGKYTIPLIGIAAAAPSVISNSVRGLINPFIEGYKLNGLSSAIRRGTIQLAKDAISGITSEKLAEPIVKDLDKGVKETVAPIVGGAGINAGRNIAKSFRKHLYDNLYPVSYSFGSFIPAVGKAIKDTVLGKTINIKKPNAFKPNDVNSPTSLLLEDGTYSYGSPASVVINNARQDAFALYNKLPQTYNTFKQINKNGKTYYIPDLNNSYLRSYSDKYIRTQINKILDDRTAYHDIVNSAGGFTGPHKINIVSGDIDNPESTLIGSIDFSDIWDVNGLQDYQFDKTLGKKGLSWIRDLELGDITGALPFKVNSSVPFIRQNNQYKIIFPDDKTLPQDALKFINNSEKFYYNPINYRGTRKYGGLVTTRPSLK